MCQKDMDKLQQTRFNSAVDFLLYSYFGIVMDDDVETVLDRIIARAYRDAASHVLSIKYDDKKADCKNEASDKIKKAINDLREGEKKDFDDWHGNLINCLLAKYENCVFNDGRKFSVGIAQKWINMTMKYIFVLWNFMKGIEHKDNSFVNDYSGIVTNYCEYFHVPLDSYIFKVMDEQGISRPSKESWSKISDKETYKGYQKNICDAAEKQGNKAPIDWEGPAWIDQAKKRNR